MTPIDPDTLETGGDDDDDDDDDGTGLGVGAQVEYVPVPRWFWEALADLPT